jgi:8-oxo-dGTP diphosphatase
LLKDDIPYDAHVLGQNTCLDQIRTYGSGKDPRGGNTTVYAVQLTGDADDIAKKLLIKCDDVSEVGIFKLNDLPDLAFDHFKFLTDYFKKLKRYKNPIPTTDLIMEYNDGKKEGIILIERRNDPFKGCLALPGGYAEYGLTFEENAIKEAKEETGLDVKIIDPEKPFCVHSNPKRDPRYHITNNAYIAKATGVLKKGNFDDAKDPTLYSLREVASLIDNGKLAFDHARILEKYLASKDYKK